MLGRIPYEIFSQIIKLAYVHESSITSSLNDFDEINLPPIKATHVCRAWRTALLSDPAMWTGIKLRISKIYLDELNQTLSRSGSLPLDILIEWRDPRRGLDMLYDLGPVLSVISQEMHRCRHLQIVISESLVPFLFRRLDHSLPMLQKFYLEVFGDEFSETRLMLRGIHMILFSGDAPSLTHVHLQIPARMEDLRLSLFKNLSSLHLQFMSDATIDGSILLSILQSSPHLRILDITGSYLILEIASSPPPSYLIPLPHLRQLLFRGRCGIKMVNFFLEHLILAMENIIFDITCLDLRPRISDSAPLLYFLSQHRFTFLSITFNSLDLIIELFKRMDQGPPATCFLLDGNSVFKTICPDTYTLMDYLPDFLRTFNLSDITHLCLGGKSLKSVTLRSIFYSLENLQYLYVHHGIRGDPSQSGSSLSRSYLKALMPQSLHHLLDTDANAESELTNLEETGQNHSFPCPHLHTLEIILLYDPLPSRLDEAYLRVLVQCSRIRKQVGHPFKFIVRCRGSLEFAKDMAAWLKPHEDVAVEVSVD